MKCYNHPDRDAVSTCTVCGRGLCKECTDLYEPVMCEKCRLESVEKEQQETKALIQRKKKDLRSDIIFSFISLVIGFFIAWGVSRFFDGPLDYQLYNWYYLFVFTLPFALRVRRSLIVAGCIMPIIVFFIACAISPICFLYGVIDNVMFTIRYSSNKVVGVLLSLLYMVALAALIIFLENKLWDLRIDYLDTYTRLQIL